MRTTSSAIVPPGQVVENPTPLGWGYNSDLGTDVGGSCWDLPSNPEDYAVVQNVDSVTATHRWSSTKEEAMSEIHAEMDADADFGVVDADIEAAYDATINSSSSSELLTVKVFVRSVNVDFEMPGEFNDERCTLGDPDPMGSADFLTTCGDRYIASQDYGGYLIFVAETSQLTESEREDVSADLGVDYSIGSGNLAGYANTFAQLKQKNIEFRVVSRGLTQLLALNGNPLTTVSPADILTDLATLRQDWVQAADQGNFPDSDYGVVVDQQMNRYTTNSDLYGKCTGRIPGPGMACYEDLMRKTMGKIHNYEYWLDAIKTQLTNMGDYYWGATTASANQNKDEYQEVADDLEVCLQKIQIMIDGCSEAARDRSIQGLPKIVCYECNDGEVPYNCEPHFKYPDRCSYDVERPRIKCDYDDLKSRVRSLSEEVIPYADLPPNGQMASMTKLSQHDPGVNLGYINDTICALGGISGEMASTSEEVKLEQINNNNWYFKVSSSRSGITHTLRSQAWCALHSYFHDGVQNGFSTFSDVEASQYNNEIPFVDASQNELPDKYARALNGVSGNFAGGAERGKINTQNRLEVHSNQGQLYAWAAAFGLDDPANSSITSGFPNNNAEISASTNSKPEKEWVRKPLISVGDGFCYLHHIGGEFDGKDEAAKIYQEDGKWMLAVSGLCKDQDGWDLFSDGPCIDRKQIEATASCYLYDQSQ